MTTVVQRYAERKGKLLVLCDFSPPRGADLSTVEQVRQVGADFVCVAYSPGKSVRVDSMVMAHLIARDGGQEVIFNLACRDMNRLAIQNHLLGAQLLGLENVLVVLGDRFTEPELATVRNVSDYRPTDMVRAIKALNQGVDYRGLKLRAPTAFCVGATMDLGGNNLERVALTTHQRVDAGADFFVTQPLYDISKADQFLAAYLALTGEPLQPPVFYGLQIMAQDGIIFGRVPEEIQRQVASGRPPVDIAVEQLHTYLERGFTNVYLVPPILRGGRRDYESARRVLQAFGR